MVFASTSFLFLFLPFFLLVNAIIGPKFKNIFLILASLLFYVWGEAFGVILLMILCVVNYGIAKLLFCFSSSGREDNKNFFIDTFTRASSTFTSKLTLFKKSKLFIQEWIDAKFVLFIGVLLNLSVLFHYKYFDWLVVEIEYFLGEGHIHATPSVLPLGISFFIFHAISYLVDIYKGGIPKHRFVDFATYFVMFPHLVAGPIVRFSHVQGYIRNREISKELFCYGVFRFILGVNKKVLIANSVAPLADMAFHSNIPHISTIDAWIGIFAYTVQIYFDFSGYSDMAIGLAAMIGIRFHENFLSPYQGSTIKEFWRRWHISLSTWFRDYVYFPLGGGRCVKWKVYRNLLLVFVLCGLWHGAESTFLIWGIFHGVFLILERGKFGEFVNGLPFSIRRTYCLFVVMIGWVFFRAVNLDQAIEFLKCMFSFNFEGTQLCSPANILILVCGLFVSLFGKRHFSQSTDGVLRIRTSVLYLNLLLFFLSAAILYTSNRNPFIYFNF